MRSLRAHHVRIRLPELSVAKVAWRANAASLGAATVIATVAMLHQTRWGAMVACLSFLAFLGSALVYRIAQLPVRRLRP